ncbi:uncharacterized protein LAESUDRAFT_645823 [Laetiporus sulphureus 93-53]|uniref:Uncharacterized protein n=1 Tax=Laetiporus sulphureus 93-53 TaxID=1314785 RepID=A0A165G947_9APHY|nr:uncharacterized protein LAESUDRAFT_645823 [Laetiporus sulphureus 93-53]KZT10007.1 hypothetical protein LAESUDRAFT_645823 [Laetiporus sulphureus 93-53]
MQQFPSEADVAYCRPSNHDADDYWEQVASLEKRVVRTKQLHTCTRGCLRTNRYSVLKCKCRAPWTLSQVDMVDEKGQWQPKRMYGYLNGYIPAITVNCRCNNDGKLLTNCEETNNITFYVTGYTAKKQGRSYNTSALLAKGLIYHYEDETYIHQIQEQTCMLLFRSVNILNRQQEMPAPMIFSYLMGWGDVVKSHHYITVYWTSFAEVLLNAYPALHRNGR